MRLLLATILLLFAQPVVACTVPVFRYGLDHWSPTRYVVQVPRDRINGVDWLQEVADRKGVPLVVEPTDHETFRWLAPFAVDPLWTGVLDPETLATLIDSPARRELSQRLVGGDSVVWAYVGGMTDEDDQHVERLRKRLRVLEATVELPEIDPNDPSSKIGPGPALALRFSVLRINRDDPAERWFVRMLAGPHLEEVAEGPFVAPVFARGRVLGAMPAEYVDEQVLDEACFYLAGACSCQVKDQNPGWDVLISFDWEQSLWEAEDRRVAAASISDVAAISTSATVSAAPAPETVTYRPQSKANNRVSAVLDPSLLSGLLIALVCGSVALVFGRNGR